MRLRQLLALAPLVVLASVGLAPTSSAQDYVGSAPGAGSDEAGLPPDSPPGGGGDYVGLPPEGEEDGDYVGLPPGTGGGGGDYVGADLVGVAAPLPPRVPDLGAGAPADDRGSVAGIGSHEEGRPVGDLPVSPTDVAALGGFATAGLVVAARHARVAR